MDETFEFRPIGVVRSSRTQIVDDGWDDEQSSIELLAPFDERALRGLDGFSHVEVIYVLDRSAWTEERVLRRPRGNAAWPEVGIFAQRAKDRPNPIGLSVCAIDSVKGVRIKVRGLDAVDGTPVLDLKPWVAQFGPRGPTAQPGWMSELMEGYW
jgi:tRNA-Thr(GGU) m(6)t(6)A37 methyltransferase TsaA